MVLGGSYGVLRTEVGSAVCQGNILPAVLSFLTPLCFYSKGFPSSDFWKSEIPHCDARSAGPTIQPKVFRYGSARALQFQGYPCHSNCLGGFQDHT